MDRPKTQHPAPTQPPHQHQVRVFSETRPHRSAPRRFAVCPGVVMTERMFRTRQHQCGEMLAKSVRATLVQSSAAWTRPYYIHIRGDAVDPFRRIVADAASNVCSSHEERLSNLDIIFSISGMNARAASVMGVCVWQMCVGWSTYKGRGDVVMERKRTMRVHKLLPILIQMMLLSINIGKASGAALSR